MKAKLIVEIDYSGPDAKPEIIERLLEELVNYAEQKGHFQDEHDLVVGPVQVTVEIQEG